MKKIKIITACVVAINIYACKDNPVILNKYSKKDSIEISAKAPTNPVNKAVINDTLTSIQLSTGDGIQTIHGSLQRPGDHVKIKIKIIDGDSLYAVLTPVLNDATMRINQVLLPDGTADGPFGRSLKYVINQPGIYTLIIANSLMAEGKTTGEYNIAISVKD